MNEQQLNEKFGVSEETIEAWASEYEADDWSEMKIGEVVRGRPRIYQEPMQRIRVTLPRGAIVAMNEYCSHRDISRSELVRRAIGRELASVQ